MGIALSNLAFLAAWDGHPQDAIRLAAAAARVKEEAGGPPGGFGGILEGDPADQARPHLSADEADRAWDEGWALSLMDAIAVAERLGVPDSVDRQSGRRETT
jgi:hypothetical protein